MRFTESVLSGVFRIDVKQFQDARGAFYESFRADVFEAETGVPFLPRQINYSVSQRNTLRGIHGVALPPGQAKFVNCVRGALRDVVVDLRIGSPTFGQYESNLLEAGSGRCVYVPEGMGHGFLALADDSVICYVLSTTYVPGTQINIDPLDPDLAIGWGYPEPPLMSEADRSAMSLADALAGGVLAHWDQTRPRERVSRE
ncbi:MULTISPECIES: dTDP-4-dehydrorhamnose 3,5-epimerase family protein [unclassified Micromonospora]|uniref:dTDP-4-dehydrorhamnose 3,5-epimerase family protein n=1 Tax=unclassified Micromonospora TaxID=2617518 RepID=UPI00363A75AD